MVEGQITDGVNREIETMTQVLKSMTVVLLAGAAVASGTDRVRTKKASRSAGAFAQLVVSSTSIAHQADSTGSGSP